MDRQAFYAGFSTRWGELRKAAETSVSDQLARNYALNGMAVPSPVARNDKGIALNTFGQGEQGVNRVPPTNSIGFGFSPQGPGLDFSGMPQVPPEVPQAPPQASPQPSTMFPGPVGFGFTPQGYPPPPSRSAAIPGYDPFTNSDPELGPQGPPQSPLSRPAAIPGYDPFTNSDPELGPRESPPQSTPSAPTGVMGPGTGFSLQQPGFNPFGPQQSRAPSPRGGYVPKTLAFNAAWHRMQGEKNRQMRPQQATLLQTPTLPKQGAFMLGFQKRLAQLSGGIS